MVEMIFPARIQNNQMVEEVKFPFTKVQQLMKYTDDNVR